MSVEQTFGSCYWGFNKPGCFLFAKVLESGRVLIRADFKFVRKPVEQVASEILARARDLGIHRFTAIYADPEMFAKQTTVKSSAMEAEPPSQTFARFGLPMTPSGTNVIHGWMRCHEYLRDAPDGRPWLLMDPGCKSLARTLPSLVQNPNEPDDLEGEDYAAQALRILLSARPAPSSTVIPKGPAKPWTVAWLRELDESDARRSRGILSR